MFATPDRDIDAQRMMMNHHQHHQHHHRHNPHTHHPGHIPKPEDSPAPAPHNPHQSTKTVTPPESGSRDIPGGKQVRFDQDKADETDQKEDVALPLSKSTDSPTSNGSGGSRGLVSRRGGRYGSPGRLPNSSSGTVGVKKESVLEYKTYRSPQRRRRETVYSDPVPSLCSSHSGGLASSASMSSTRDGKQDLPTQQFTSSLSSTKGELSLSSSSDKDRRPSSISCDPSKTDTTSPLGPAHDVGNDAANSTAKPHKAGAIVTATADALATDGGSGGVSTSTAATKKDDNARRNPIFSPPPASREEFSDKAKKTPTRSPVGQFQSLPSLKDAKISSPCGIFLSPYPPSPSAYATIAEGPSFDSEDKPMTPKQPTIDAKTAKERDHESERAMATPTDFSLDFGKEHRSTPSFDASNGKYN